MYNVTRLLDVKHGEHDRVLNRVRIAADRSGAWRWIVEPTDSGSRNGGDILAHLRFADESQWQSADPRLAEALADPAITRINGATYRGEPTDSGAPGSVYRALLLRVHPDTSPRTLERFEAELTSMADYVPTICSWQLSRVCQTMGATGWTHVFEQEFTDAAGLMGPYLMHPIHWAVVDRWFDPESTDVIVRDRVCHSFCAIDHAVLHV